MLVMALAWVLIGYLIYLWSVVVKLPDPILLQLCFVCLIGLTIFGTIRRNLFFKIKSEIVLIDSSGYTGKILIGLVFLQIFLNLIGALAPELSFDTLWYHLTLPKLYLSWGEIRFPPGNLLPWGIPRLGEVWYLLSLAVDHSGTAAKLLHLAAGVVSLALIYQIAKRYSPPFFSFLVALAWYSSLSVSWMSTTAYVDLFSAMFILLGVWRLMVNSNLILVGILFGVAASCKLIYLFPAIAIFGWLVLRNEKTVNGFKNGLTYMGAVVIPIIPWLLISVVRTGDPIYPLLTYQPGDVVAPAVQFLSKLFSLPAAIWSWTFHPDTPISPVYLALLPLVILSWKKLNDNAKEILVLGGLITISTWFFPEFTNRYLLPGTAVISIGLAALIASVRRRFRAVIVLFVFTIAILNISSRVLAERKSLNFLLGQETRNDYLMENLNFTFGDFFDDQGKIAAITGSQPALVDGIHNLFYIDFPFDHISWAETGRKYPFILADEKQAGKYAKLPVVYQNNITHVVLFANNDQ